MSTGQNQSSNRETTIVDNEVYNLLTVLANKLQGLAAYTKYQADGSANAQVWKGKIIGLLFLWDVNELTPDPALATLKH